MALLAFACSAFLPAVHAAEEAHQRNKKLVDFLKIVHQRSIRAELRHMCEKAALQKQVAELQKKLAQEKREKGAACALVRTLEERAEFAEETFIAARKHDNANWLAVYHRALEQEKATENHNKTVATKEIILSMEEDPDEAEIKRLREALAAAQVVIHQQQTIS